MSTSRLLDYATFPAFALATVTMTMLCIHYQFPLYTISGVVLGTLAIAAAIAERIRPQRADYVPLDQPFWVDTAHFLFNYNLGYGLALGAAMLASHFVQSLFGSPWPSTWPLFLQVFLAILLSEGFSYWQHRSGHRFPWLWKFHALHHSGGRLNLMRTGRFHFVDIATAGFLFFIPLTLLGAPEIVITWLASLVGAVGVLGHANIRVRTPSWLDRIVCTPAVHRHHHSIRSDEMDRNFGTSVMLFDMLFGSYALPKPEGPEAMGIPNDPIANSKGYWRQTVDPLLRPSSDYQG